MVTYSPPDGIGPDPVRAFISPAPRERPITIAIIGAGFSGTLLSLHLLRHAPPATRLLLIERNSQFGRGLAAGQDEAAAMRGRCDDLEQVPVARQALPVRVLGLPRLE